MKVTVEPIKPTLYRYCNIQPFALLSRVNFSKGYKSRWRLRHLKRWIVHVWFCTYDLPLLPSNRHGTFFDALHTHVLDTIGRRLFSSVTCFFLLPVFRNLFLSDWEMHFLYWIFPYFLFPDSSFGFFVLHRLIMIRKSRKRKFTI